MTGNVTIADYDPQWPTRYEEERRLILGAAGDVISAIEHIGSTSVPGLAAKPIIDIMPGVRSPADADRCIESLRGIGYEYVPEYEAEMPDRRYFRKGPPEAHYHMHMVEVGSDFWERHLLFRDALRSDTALSGQYERLKRRLATELGADARAYTEAKTSFIESAVAAARARQQ